MQISIIISVTIVMAAISSVEPAPSKVSSRLKQVDIDTVLKSERLLNGYLKCLLENIKCTPEGTELRRVMPDLLAEECNECSEEQKEAGIRLVKYLAKEKKPDFKKLTDMYDSKRVYRTKYAKEIKEAGIELD
ncbi:hypothetical protein WA026_013617 [Henosepilachna vigintioctopunctata]|uniref:Chemosensory protein n=1 Tax=Henosepilachna vigintioctopunctata TaxID=420089 RepID=A0AAW1VDG0_9CUCU